MASEWLFTFMFLFGGSLIIVGAKCRWKYFVEPYYNPKWDWRYYIHKYLKKVLGRNYLVYFSYSLGVLLISAGFYSLIGLIVSGN
jgi:hypothetical protein